MLSEINFNSRNNDYINFEKNESLNRLAELASSIINNTDNNENNKNFNLQKTAKRKRVQDAESSLSSPIKKFRLDQAQLIKITYKGKELVKTTINVKEKKSIKELSSKNNKNSNKTSDNEIIKPVFVEETVGQITSRINRIHVLLNEDEQLFSKSQSLKSKNLSGLVYYEKILAYLAQANKFIFLDQMKEDCSSFWNTLVDSILISIQNQGLIEKSEYQRNLMRITPAGIEKLNQILNQ